MMLIGTVGFLLGCAVILFFTASGRKVSVTISVNTSSPANVPSGTAAAVPPMSGAYRGPGDIVPGATAYYGLRAYNAAYAAPGTNKAINVRRASDNTTADIVILPTGSLDTATAKTFCAATICYVARWYDQTGNGHDITQYNESQQPELTFSGYGGFPAVAFNYSQMTYLSGSFPWVSGNQPWGAQVALLNVSPSNWYEPIFDYGTTDINESLFALTYVGRSAAYQFSASVYGTDELSGIPTTAPAAAAFYSTGTALGGYVNGVNWQQFFNSSSITGTNFVLGGSPTQVGIWLTGSIGEVILYPSSLDANGAKKLADSERAYYGF
jgi:hypothetical protein